MGFNFDESGGSVTPPGFERFPEPTPKVPVASVETLTLPFFQTFENVTSVHNYGDVLVAD
jgi:hypothetical protein